MTVRSFAPGEIILFGEHSVVYGRKGLAISIERGIEVIFDENEQGVIVESSLGVFRGTISGDNIIRVIESSEPLKPFSHMIDRCFYFARANRGFKARIISELPHASGLASSASVSAAFISGLLFFLGRLPDKRELLDMVYKSELEIQKRGSIIGSACSVYGGMVEVFDGRFCHKDFDLDVGKIIIADSGEKCTTDVTTGLVKTQLDRDPDKTNILFDKMHAIA